MSIQSISNDYAIDQISDNGSFFVGQPVFDTHGELVGKILEIDTDSVKIKTFQNSETSLKNGQKLDYSYPNRGIFLTPFIFGATLDEFGKYLTTSENNLEKTLDFIPVVRVDQEIVADEKIGYVSMGNSLKFWLTASSKWTRWVCKNLQAGSYDVKSSIGQAIPVSKNSHDITQMEIMSLTLTSFLSSQILESPPVLAPARGKAIGQIEIYQPVIAKESKTTLQKTLSVAPEYKHLVEIFEGSSCHFDSSSVQNLRSQIDALETEIIVIVASSDLIDNSFCNLNLNQILVVGSVNNPDLTFQTGYMLALQMVKWGYRVSFVTILNDLDSAATIPTGFGANVNGEFGSLTHIRFVR